MDLVDIVRKFTFHKLQALRVILQSNKPSFTSSVLSNALEQEGQQLGGTISALLRTKIEGHPLLLPIGKHPSDGYVWRFNDSIASKKELKNAIDKVLEEQRHYKVHS